MRNAILSADMEKKKMKQVFTVNIPKTRDFTQCGWHRKMSYTKSLAPADIEITGQHNSFGNSGLWTVQHQGCRRSGLVLKIPEGFFEHADDVLKHHMKGNSFLKINSLRKQSSIPGEMLSNEWLKYKYGVYCEHGYEGDTLYPIYYSSGNATQPSTGFAIAHHKFWLATCHQVIQ